MHTNQKLMMKIDLDQYEALLQQIKAMLSSNASSDENKIDVSTLNLEGSSSALKEMGEKMNTMESSIFDLRQYLFLL